MTCTTITAREPNDFDGQSIRCSPRWAKASARRPAARRPASHVEPLERRAMTHAGADHDLSVGHPAIGDAATAATVLSSGAGLNAHSAVRAEGRGEAAEGSTPMRAAAQPSQRGGKRRAKSPFLFTPVPEGTPLKLHAHMHVAVQVDGQPFPLPAGLGVKPEGALPIHTHDEPNVVHVESPRRMRFRLRDLLAVARREYGLPDDYVPRGGDVDHDLVVTANGKRIRSPLNLPLRDGDNILIEYQRRAVGEPSPRAARGRSLATPPGFVPAVATAEAALAAASLATVRGDILCSERGEKRSETNSGCWAPLAQPASVLNKPGGQPTINLPAGSYFHIYPHFGGHAGASFPDYALGYACSDFSHTSCSPSGAGNDPGVTTKPGFVSRSGAFAPEYRNIPPEDPFDPVPAVDPGARRRVVDARDVYLRHRNGLNHPIGLLYQGDLFQVERVDANGYALGWAYGVGVDPRANYGRVLASSLATPRK